MNKNDRQNLALLLRAHMDDLYVKLHPKNFSNLDKHNVQKALEQVEELFISKNED